MKAEVFHWWPDAQGATTGVEHCVGYVVVAGGEIVGEIPWGVQYTAQEMRSLGPAEIRRLQGLRDRAFAVADAWTRGGAAKERAMRREGSTSASTTRVNAGVSTGEV